jgi:hypothetical protein
MPRLQKHFGSWSDGSCFQNHIIFCASSTPLTRARRTDRTRISFQAEPIAELKCWRVGSWSGTRHMIKWALSQALLLAINTTATAGGKVALASRYCDGER